VTEPRGNGPAGPEDDLAALAGLDLALDELAAGRDLPAEAGGEQRALAGLAADLRGAMPAPPAGAAERGRAAFLAQAAGGRRRVWRRSLPLRLTAVAAALVVLVAVPAAARQARPGTALWPVREVGQQVRVRLADGPVDQAQLRLHSADDFLQEGAGKGEEGREAMAERAEEEIEAALEVLKDVPGPDAAAARAWADRLLVQVDALEHQDDPVDRSGSGSGTEPGDDRSGPGGGDDPSGDDRSGRGGGGGGDDGSGSGSGGSGSGSSRSGSERSGSGDD
jgi:hypothetical protein